jgi:hypothetical protein
LKFSFSSHQYYVYTNIIIIIIIIIIMCCFCNWRLLLTRHINNKELNWIELNWIIIYYNKTYLSNKWRVNHYAQAKRDMTILPVFRYINKYRKLKPNTANTVQSIFIHNDELSRKFSRYSALVFPCNTKQHTRIVLARSLGKEERRYYYQLINCAQT